MLKISDLPFAFISSFVVLIACANADTPAPQAAPASIRHSSDSLPAAALVSKEYLLGKFNPAGHPDFVSVGKPYADKPGMMLRKEALEDFKKMWESARKAGISLKIISSTRNFDQQKNIWEGKWSRFEKETPEPKNRALKILEYSSMPGSSRHHWGTDIDLNDLNNPSFEKGGKHEKVYTWLVAHAQEFGFCQPYTAGRPHGYHEEKWHWSYTPLSKPFLAQYKNSVQDADIQGFLGSNLAREIGAVKHYVLGINQNCAE
ncbi:MAG: M15 family metallopeptidase [Saprospiraceae bacterium]|nr:M15 family metallopeptidase [Saprospiraceae bacterium]